MEASSPGPLIITFVVRFWRESSVAGTRWRGQIDHVQSGASASFLDLCVMTEILQSFGIMAGSDRQPDEISTRRDYAANGPHHRCAS
jgi:hypothetical protein